MDAYVVKKRPREEETVRDAKTRSEAGDEESTEIKLALLASMHDNSEDVLLEALLASGGSVTEASKLLATSFTGSMQPPPFKKRISSSLGHQSSLSSSFQNHDYPSPPKRMTKKGQTLHLFSPQDVASHTPCSIIHNFLPPRIAEELLREMLDESQTWGRDSFKLFDNIVTSPHTVCFYVDDWDSQEAQKTEYIYNGECLKDVRQTKPVMREVSKLVAEAVNEEIRKRILSHYPDQKKLKYQMSAEWKPNTSFVNCYAGGQESVGYHSDQLTYLGPRAVIGSISLGVAREFRVRRVLAKNKNSDLTDPIARRADDARADGEGQVAIHLPHNSLLVMHAEMQEEWKHSIAPARVIDPHPIAGNKRINITYRYYRESFHPKNTPKCKCNVPCVLRCVQKQAQTRGRYMWMCHTGYTPGSDGCGFFQWAEFDDDGEPPWAWSKEDESEHRDASNIGESNQSC